MSWRLICSSVSTLMKDNTAKMMVAHFPKKCNQEFRSHIPNLDDVDGANAGGWHRRRVAAKRSSWQRVNAMKWDEISWEWKKKDERRRWRRRKGKEFLKQVKQGVKTCLNFEIALGRRQYAPWLQFRVHSTAIVQPSHRTATSECSAVSWSANEISSSQSHQADCQSVNSGGGFVVWSTPAAQTTLNGRRQHYSHVHTHKDCLVWLCFCFPWRFHRNWW